MFRNPRTAGPVASETPLVPSTGRAPTPPSALSGHNPLPQGTPATSTTLSNTHLVGSVKSQPKKMTSTTSGSKGKGKPNGNIMNFFKRADPTSTATGNVQTEEEDLFIQSSPFRGLANGTTQTPTPPRDGSSNGDSPQGAETERMWTGTNSSRYNEDETPTKRRRLGFVSTEPNPTGLVAVSTAQKGPFLDDSDSDDEDLQRAVVEPTQQDEDVETSELATEHISGAETAKTLGTSILSKAPPLKRESTSIRDADDFEGLEDFIDDEFPEEGEEFQERRWMEEQAQLEMGLADDDEDELENTAKTQSEMMAMPQSIGSTSCPICSGNITELSDQQVSIHVNDCIDGKAQPLPEQQQAKVAIPAPQTVKPEIEPAGYKRFQRAAIARPGQDNPFNLNATTGTTSTAFGKLMSGNAEDNAWATAAASEAASRGKPAYQRTCPFYKIMPGFFICVDAFRYGAVQGCNAYFLSHFHSDHYIGLTSLWCHGPIYCSHVTANLVRRQLRVDPKWVVDLEFDEKVEVPNTQGVDVTMIPANHCPGSSLFLFEKAIGKGRNPRIQRVLHCGDFRACPAHIQHPKLRPDIVDSVTKRNIAQQKIDVCYLDTTYLNPRYAFPSQEEVIKACGDMCVSLSKDFVDEDDGWEQTKRERAGAGMTKFVRKTSLKEEGPSIKEEVSVEDAKKPQENSRDDIKIKVEGEKSDDEDQIKVEGEKSDDKDQIKSEGKKQKPRGRLLVIVGTYSIGKERICVGVAKALRSKIYAPPNKQRVCAALEDPELSALMTNDPLEAQVHMQMLMEIRAETLADYLTGYKPHFSRIVGFRPSGWNYRPPNSRFTESPAVQTVLHSDNWKSHYSMSELVPQRGSTRDANCFGVPYSEHSSFRELTMFCCALRIDKIIPTVNVGSAKSREKMKAWCEKWAMDKKKHGLLKVEDGQAAW